MKTLKIIATVFIALQMSSCASTNPAVAGSTPLCIQQPCFVVQEQTFLGALASGFGSGLGWGIGKAITKTW